VGSSGRSAASLHAKTFSVDRARVFIGSFNFDPRSANLNTEMGFIIESPALARRIRETFDRRVSARAYEPRLSDEGKLYWIEPGDGTNVRHDTEPGTSFWQRLAVRLLSLLPIEWML
jgi:putative cardiolipin synthase